MPEKASADAWVQQARRKATLTELPNFTEAGIALICGQFRDCSIASPGRRCRRRHAARKKSIIPLDQSRELFAMPSIRTRLRPRKMHAFVAVMMALAVAGCGGEPDGATSASETSSAGETSASPPANQQFDREHPVVRIETNQGSITVRLDAVRAPGTVRNFLTYAREGFYDNTLVHYVDPGKMILAGGYGADRQLKRPRISIRNEAHNGLKNLRGTIAMARDQSEIDNATSQFFINLADAPQRDHQGDTAEKYGYCVFGEVTDGLDVADRISQSATTNLGGDLIKTPEPPVVVSSVRVVR
jgi:cyclophilin family peptidyl-prolyl cis-trans isomerase